MKTVHEKIEKLLDKATFYLADDKKLHKEIRKIHKKTFELEDVYFSMHRTFKNNDITNIFGSKSNGNIFNFSGISFWVEKVLDDFRKGSDDADRNFERAYEEIENGEEFNEEFFADAAAAVKKAAREMKINITKELKRVAKENNLKRAAKKLVELVDDFALEEDI